MPVVDFAGNHDVLLRRRAVDIVAVVFTNEVATGLFNRGNYMFVEGRSHLGPMQLFEEKSAQMISPLVLSKSCMFDG